MVQVVNEVNKVVMVRVALVVQVFRWSGGSRWSPLTPLSR